MYFYELNLVSLLCTNINFDYESKLENHLIGHPNHYTRYELANKMVSDKNCDYVFFDHIHTTGPVN